MDLDVHVTDCQNKSRSEGKHYCYDMHIHAHSYILYHTIESSRGAVDEQDEICDTDTDSDSQEWENTYMDEQVNFKN